VEREGGLIFGFKILFMFQVCCKYGRETKAEREREAWPGLQRKAINK
jgi:hypothetical protein